MAHRSRHLAGTIVVLALLLFVDANARDRFDVLRTCAKESSHVGQRECLEAEWKKSSAAASATERDFLARLTKADQVPQDKARALAAAADESAAYSQFAEKHCESFALLAFGGNSQGDRRLACRIELNWQRAVQLKSIVASTP